ncbi:hypothetical protein QJS66_23505 (plasmid) [Kocuria rhizophila]|nr:hypothetical protein QJS66_23505 [Kocuria rhizophila]
MTGEPYEGYVKVTGTVEGEERRSPATSPCSPGGCKTRTAGTSTPVVQRTTPCPTVEWSAIFDVQAQTKTNKFIIDQINKIRTRMEHYVSDHKQDPEMLETPNTLGKQIRVGVREDHGGLEVRTEGWYGVTVSAPTLDALDRRVAEIRNLYGSKAEPGAHRSTVACYREFIPGEGLQNSGFSRTMLVKTLAAAIPQGAAKHRRQGRRRVGLRRRLRARGFSWTCIAIWNPVTAPG